MSDSVAFNRGFLFQTANGFDHVYFVPQGQIDDPFTNEKLSEVVTSKSEIVLFFDDVQPAQLRVSSESLKELSLTISQNLPQSEIKFYNDQFSFDSSRVDLSPKDQALIEKIKEILPSNTGENELILNFCIAIFQLHAQLNQNRQKTFLNFLQEKILQRSIIVFGDDFSAYMQFLIECVKIRPILNLLCILFSSEKNDYLKRNLQLIAEIWDRGDADRLESLVKDHTKSELQQYIERLELDEAKVAFKLEGLVREYDKHKNKARLERIDGFVREAKTRLLVFSLSDYSSEFVQSLSQKLGHLNQMKIPVKPRGFLWRIRSPQGQVGHLLGSVHFMPANLLKFHKEIMNAFERSDTLAVEFDVTKGANSEAMESRDKKRISEWPEEKKERTYQNLKKILFDRGINLDDSGTKVEFIHKASRTIVASIMMQENFVLGVDFAFLDRAKSKKMEIVDLETLEEHDEALHGIDLNSLFLTDKIDELSVQGAVNKAREIVSMWEKGYIEELKIQRDKYRGESEEGYYALAKRDLNMTQRFEKLIKSGKRVFGVVGDMHFGMLNLLKDRKFTVEQIIHDEVL